MQSESINVSWQSWREKWGDWNSWRQHAERLDSGKGFYGRAAANGKSLVLAARTVLGKSVAANAVR